jgi:hypothetical protein
MGRVLKWSIRQHALHCITSYVFYTSKEINFRGLFITSVFLILMYLRAFSRIFKYFLILKISYEEPKGGDNLEELDLGGMFIHLK